MKKPAQFWQKGNALYLYGPIGADMFFDGIDPKDVIESLAKIDDQDEIDVHLHSEGGDMFGGHAIYTALRTDGRKVNMFIDGLAASAASIIAMAGSYIEQAENAWQWVHEPMGFSFGYADDMRDTADELEAFAETSAKLYSDRTGLGIETTRQMQSEETWINAETAVDLGFADNIGKNLKIAASFNAKLLRNIPPGVRALERKANTRQQKAREIVKSILTRDSGSFERF